PHPTAFPTRRSSDLGSIRDHGVVTFNDATTPGPLRRVSVDDWKLEACPHHGPSLAIAPDGSYHVAWFTDGKARKGLFYARADSADRKSTRLNSSHVS